MSRPICYDLTHLVTRLGIGTPSGIDNVDLAYGRHFLPLRLGPSVHYGLNNPHLLSDSDGDGVIALAEAAPWQRPEGGFDAAYARVRVALTGVEDGARARAGDAAGGALEWQSAQHSDTGATAGATLGLLSNQFRFRVVRQRLGLPEQAIYLNVAQHLFEHQRYFRWLGRRVDVKAAFLIHDLLPLDYPEYFKPGYKALFGRRMQTALTYGGAFIVTTQDVRQRLMEEMRRQGRSEQPIVVAPLPSMLARRASESIEDGELAATPYFVTVGTIEPRKNHLLLLNIWRQLAEAAAAGGQRVPKLVIIGSRGWENEQVVDVLDRGLLTRPHVVEASGLSSSGLMRLMANARGLLMPSFAEGYGLPLVEALSLGTPVVATDAAVFREVTQGRAIYKSPVDGVGWREVIGDLSDAGSIRSREARDAIGGFKAPDWPGYFATIEAFLRSL